MVAGLVGGPLGILEQLDQVGGSCLSIIPLGDYDQLPDMVRIG